MARKQTQLSLAILINSSAPKIETPLSCESLGGKTGDHYLLVRLTHDTVC